MTVIVAAMAEELAVLRPRLVNARPITVPGLREVVGGRLGRREVILAATGDGERNAREGIAALLRAVRASELLVLGIAGGLTDELREGDLVVATRVLVEAPEGNGRAAPIGDAVGAAVEAAVAASGARPGIVVTARHIADSALEKRRLAWQAGASPAVVDLESAGYVTAARRAGLPWMVVRAVSDTSEEALPALLNRARDDGGAVRKSGVVRGLFGDPSALPALLSLRRRLKLCAEALARAATAVVTSDVLSALHVSPPPTPGTEDRPGAQPPGALS